MDCSRDAVTRRRQERAELLHRELERVTCVLKACPEVRLILLFGSLATHTSGEHSDLDLVVVMHTDQPYLSRIDTVLQSIQPETDIDLLVYTPEEWKALQRDSSFVRRQGAEGKVIYEAAA
jgi:uncharacterized protein